MAFTMLSRSAGRVCFVHRTPFSSPTSLLRRSPRNRGFCDVVAVFKPENENLSKVLDNTNRELIKPILDQAVKVSRRRDFFHSDFLTPNILEDALIALKNVPDVKFVVQGGYPEAEHCRLAIGHPDVISSVPDAVSAFSVSGNFSFSPASHGDFLGAVLSAGIKREKIGDVLLQSEKGAQIITVPELVDFLAFSVNKVRNVPVTCSPIPLLALKYEPPRTRAIRSVEASLRVDAVASAGFQISRSKLVSLISGGDVRVNWTEVSKNGTILKTGDIISIRGKGRLQLREIKTTKKGKYSIELIRYL